MKSRDSALQERMDRLRLREADLRIICCRASGPGGQHVNKVSTAVEITHAPSGTTVHCSDSRSQHTNRALALLRLVEKMEAQRAEAAQARKAEFSKRRRQRAKRSYGTKQEMLRDKKHRGETKKMRGRVSA
ncbi:MAG TPA: peptide chain release factor-like protein [Chthoniobacterales bacterium]|nr:peptide chain release factor-like protein [Chthoniobacterales bacterium]